MTRSTPRGRAGTGTSVFKAIQRVNRSEQVRNQPEEAIRRGDYGPGDRLPSERELTEMFGVSRVSEREAVSALVAVGLVDVQQGRGCFVATPSADAYASFFHGWLEDHREEIRQLLAVRGALDELAAHEAALYAGAREIRAIEKAHDAFARAAVDPLTDVETLEGLDIAFHESLAAARRNSLLAGPARSQPPSFGVQKGSALERDPPAQGSTRT
jgi:GntR family transcriptional repressor for pyruvate dehydrogenase complex